MSTKQEDDAAQRVSVALQNFADFLYLHGHLQASKAVEDSIMIGYYAVIGKTDADSQTKQTENKWR